MSWIKGLDEKWHPIKVKGEKGDPGKDGKQGTPGKDGKDGKPGLAGKDGKDGQQGAQGPRGYEGPPGASGVLKLFDRDHNEIGELLSSPASIEYNSDYFRCLSDNIIDRTRSSISIIHLFINF